MNERRRGETMGQSTHHTCMEPLSMVIEVLREAIQQVERTARNGVIFSREHPD